MYTLNENKHTYKITSYKQVINKKLEDG